MPETQQNFYQGGGPESDPNWPLVKEKVGTIAASSGVEVRVAEKTPLEGCEAITNICGSIFMMIALPVYLASQARNVIRPRTIRIFEAFGKVIDTYD